QENEDASSIEANMFDNSTHVHQPVVKADLLKPNAPKKIKLTQPTVNVTGPKLIKDDTLGLDFYRLQLHDPLIAKLM
ncbi:hypothetical protein ACYT7O_11115, partial [Streptococcus pyogenes]